VANGTPHVTILGASINGTIFEKTISDALIAGGGTATIKF
jgi:hypothetical protein